MKHRWLRELSPESLKGTCNGIWPVTGVRQQAEKSLLFSYPKIGAREHRKRRIKYVRSIKRYYEMV